MDDTKADISSLSRHIFNRAIKYIKMGGPISFYSLSHVLICLHVSILLRKSLSVVKSNDPCRIHVLCGDVVSAQYGALD